MPLDVVMSIPVRQPVAGVGNVVVLCFIMRIATSASIWTSRIGERVDVGSAMLGDVMLRLLMCLSWVGATRLLPWVSCFEVETNIGQFALRIRCAMLSLKVRSQDKIQAGVPRIA